MNRLLRKTGWEATAIKTPYWRPGEDHREAVLSAVRKHLQKDDIIVVSEKAIATAKGLLVDESKIPPSRLATAIALVWVRWVWGYILGVLCHLLPTTMIRLRNYPLPEGARHKQLALKHSNLLQAFQHVSEGGIDASNLPYSYACLPLKDPDMEVSAILSLVREATGKNVGVMIVDTDKTYSWRNIHLCPRSTSFPGLVSGGGLSTYVVCRAFRLKARATPIAAAGVKVTTEEALDIAEITHRARGRGAGWTVWDMAELFGVALTQVTWEMLDRVEHRPVVLVRRVRI